jgi:hypothetical protein
MTKIDKKITIPRDFSFYKAKRKQDIIKLIYKDFFHNNLNLNYDKHSDWSYFRIISIINDWIKTKDFTKDESDILINYLNETMNNYKFVKEFLGDKMPTYDQIKKLKEAKGLIS